MLEETGSFLFDTSQGMSMLGGASPSPPLILWYSSYLSTVTSRNRELVRLQALGQFATTGIGQMQLEGAQQ